MKEKINHEGKKNSCNYLMCGNLCWFLSEVVCSLELGPYCAMNMDIIRNGDANLFWGTFCPKKE